MVQCPYEVTQDLTPSIYSSLCLLSSCSKTAARGKPSPPGRSMDEGRKHAFLCQYICWKYCVNTLLIFHWAEIWHICTLSCFPDGYSPWGYKTFRHNWATFTFTFSFILSCKGGWKWIFSWTSRYVFQSTKDWVIIIIHVSSLLLFL